MSRLIRLACMLTDFHMKRLLDIKRNNLPNKPEDQIQGSNEDKVITGHVKTAAKQLQFLHGQICCLQMSIFSYSNSIVLLAS